MFTRIRQFFRKKKETEQDTDDIAIELWSADFKKPAHARFAPESGTSYECDIGPKGLILYLKKKGIFAWTLDPLYRYRNFIAEATIRFDSSGSGDGSGERAGTHAAGILFRYLNESTFYSLLVSDGGMVRLDAVMNGTPLPVLGWTETVRTERGGENRPGNEWALRLIARDTGFLVTVNDTWVAECQDDTIQAAGKIAFAGQNWSVYESASTVLSSFVMDSRPYEVESVHSRWSRLLPIPASAHVNLARTWYAMGKYVPAIIELKRAWKDREPDMEDRLLAAQVYLAQQLLPEAETEVRKALALDGTHAEAAAELGGILYLQNRFVELDELLAATGREAIEASPFLSNLEGHLAHWKGEPSLSAQAYERAGKLTPDQGLFPRNAGNEWLAAGEIEKARSAWISAARLFLAGSEYADLGETLDSLRAIAPDDPQTLELEAKFHYAEGRREEASRCIDKAIESGSEDSGVWYLRGMILSEKGKAKKAIEAFRTACDLEPEFGLYRYRLAETLFFAGKECAEELAEAFRTGEGNGWVHNLAALKALAANDIDTASGSISRALELLPNERDVVVNYAEVERRFGRLDAALERFDRNDAAYLRAGGNLLVEDGRHEEADEWYRKAQSLTPWDAELLADRAANCIELDYLNEADDLLGRALDIRTSPRLYKLVSYLASRKGEFTRSEIALQQGLAEFPENPDLLYELSAVYLATNRTAKADQVRARLAAIDEGERVRALDREILEKSTVSFSCSACGRSWRVPRDLPPQGSLHLTAEPPDDLPAGTCPQCQTILCIGCGKETLGDDGRFRCRTCGTPLKLIDNNVIWLLNKWQAETIE